MTFQQRFLCSQGDRYILNELTNEVAKKFAVKGTVENCEDGRVKIVAEAETNEIDRFVAAIKTSMAGNIKQVERFESAASFEFDNFSARQ